MNTIEEDLILHRGLASPVRGIGPDRSFVEVNPVLDTTELRWFADDELPTAVVSWFTDSGTRGSYEERCDVYRMDGRRDVGLKLRSRETLEFKIRQSVGERVELPEGPGGLLEVWHKWSPAEERRSGHGSDAWIDVHKKIVKRRFSAEGDELIVACGAVPMSGSGCDVEIASVRVGEIEAWTLAFASFGPLMSRRDSILACWQGVCSGVPFSSWSMFGRSRGYAEWLEQRYGATSR